MKWLRKFRLFTFGRFKPIQRPRIPLDTDLERRQAASREVLVDQRKNVDQAIERGELPVG